jgi:peptidoglycan/LPS O-acetylase OafA/YrhL
VAGEDKLLGVELLRFACALSVLIWHYQHFAFVGLQRAADFMPEQQPFYPLLHPLYRHGLHGVEVFWCISGFIFFWKYGQAISRRAVGGYKFSVLRFSRLYPLHLVTLLFVALLQQIYLRHDHSYFLYANDLPRFFSQLFMASNWLTWEESFNGPIWSISVEILAYGLFFLTLRYLSASLPMCALMAALGALVAVFWLPTLPLFYCVMYFYVGCLAAIAHRRAGDSVRMRALVSSAAALALTGIFAARRYLAIDAIYVLVVAAPSLILLLTLHLPGGRRARRLLVAAGSMTYSSYLLHVPLQLTVVTLLSMLGLSAPIYSPVFFVGFILVALALSYWCYALFELPAQNWLRRKLLAPEAVRPAAPGPRCRRPGAY